MTNDNNNINELVADDDPTVELEIPSFSRIDEDISESDAKTFDADDLDDKDVSAGVTVAELKSDLLSRNKTISELQYDIQQLHTKWLGLEAEIGAREAQTEQLNQTLASAQDAVARNEKLIKKRDARINSLTSEISQRDDQYRKLENRVGDLDPGPVDPSPNTEDADPAPDLQSRLSRTEKYADEIRQQSQDLIESNSNARREIESLSQRLIDATQANTQITDELAIAGANAGELQSNLDEIQSRHEKEIRLLRFELGEAQDTVVQTEEVNSQLASDLVDTHGFKDELERMLGDVEEQSSERIEELQKEVVKLGRKADRYEQKLTTKSEAITVLLAELAKKSEHIDASGEIEVVIHDIDERISERSSENGQPENRATADRITRLLIGTVDNQVLRFPLFKDRLTIGRTDDNDIQLKAAYVSRRHAVIQTDGDATRIIDWGSKNGIQVNSTKVGEHFLAHGDIIMIGNARFRYEERKKRES
jgi:chromosome segregation ATPase